MWCKIIFRIFIITIYMCANMFHVHPAAAPNADRYAHEKDPNYWLDLGEKELHDVLRAKQGGVAKNVIMFLGDGMGLSTSTAGRIWAGQQLGLHGEEHELSWDKFPYTGLSKTYAVDAQTTDSAASGTAFLCGVKTREGVLGLNGHTSRGNCSSVQGNQVESVLNWALAAGKSTGLVTTTRVTHATPASAYAKSADRNWETDRWMPQSERGCKDIAYQLVMENPRIQVLLGGGRAVFLPEGSSDPDPDPDFNALIYSRLDGLNMIEEWKKEKAQHNFLHSYVYDKIGLDNVNPQTTDYLLGLFNQGNMQYEVERNKTKEPSIAEMTSKAIQILSKNPEGFFLLVEGGRIDHANHENYALKAFAEVEAMDQAVKVAMELTSHRDTLIVVTADHSHVLSIAGYAARGNSITGVSMTNEGKADIKYVTDAMPYTTLVYGNGPGGDSASRENLTGVDTHAPSYQFDSAVPMEYETHAGEDVAIYAKGPQAFLFTGTHEQSYIAVAMAYASCLGPYSEGKLCARRHTQPDQSQCSCRGDAFVSRPNPIHVTLTALILFVVLKILRIHS